jgi:hypothetical protein
MGFAQVWACTPRFNTFSTAFALPFFLSVVCRADLASVLLGALFGGGVERRNLSPHPLLRPKEHRLTRPVEGGLRSRPRLGLTGRLQGLQKQAQTASEETQMFHGLLIRSFPFAKGFPLTSHLRGTGSRLRELKKQAQAAGEETQMFHGLLIRSFPFAKRFPLKSHLRGTRPRLRELKKQTKAASEETQMLHGLLIRSCPSAHPREAGD